MIEYITQTGMFGVLWILTFITFIGISYRFIKSNGIWETIKAVIPVIIMLTLFNVTALELMGKTNFDLPLTFAKDMWFLMGHVFIQLIFITIDKTCLEFWKEQKGER